MVLGTVGDSIEATGTMEAIGSIFSIVLGAPIEEIERVRPHWLPCHPGGTMSGGIKPSY